MRKLILASNSPRRKSLLALFGYPFEVAPADIDETQLPGEEPIDYVGRLAYIKANSSSDTNVDPQKGLVIAADTVVVLGGVLLGKPVDADEASRMLQQLRGRGHQVYTGIAIRDPAFARTFGDVCCTDVPMRNYTNEEIEAYVRTGDPMDKAGAYAIQHPGFRPVADLKGCYASVMGLPLCHLAVGLRGFGIEYPPDLASRCQTTLDFDCPVFTSILGKG